MNKQEIAITGLACMLPGARNLREFWSDVLTGRTRTPNDTQGRQPILREIISAALKNAQVAPESDKPKRIRLVMVSETSGQTQSTNHAVVERVTTFLAKRFPELSSDQLDLLKTELTEGTLDPDFTESPESASSAHTEALANGLGFEGWTSVNATSPLLAIEQGITHLQQVHCDVAVIATTDSASAVAVVLEAYNGEAVHERAYAIIKAIRSSRKSGTSDNSNHYASTMQRAYKAADLDSQSVGLLESLRIDDDFLRGLSSVFGDKKLSHLPTPTACSKAKQCQSTAVASLALLLKTALCLSNKVLPPSTDSAKMEVPFYDNPQAFPWIRHESKPPRRAAVSDFATGGTFAHVILEEVPQATPEASTRSRTPGIPWETDLIVISANSITELAEKISALRDSLSELPSDIPLQDVAYTQCLGFDERQPCRLALVCKNCEQLSAYLETCAQRLAAERTNFDDLDDVYFTADSSKKRGKIAFIFPGMGFPGLLGTYVDHLQELCLHFPEVREIFDKVDYSNEGIQTPTSASHFFFPPAFYSEQERKALRQRLGTPRILTETISQDPETRNLAPFGVAVANWLSWVLLRELDVPVDMLFGQSFGDLCALSAAQSLDFDEIIPLYWQVTIDASAYISDAGRMVLVSATQERLAPLLQGFQGLSIAIHLTPELQIVGGETNLVQEFEKRLQAENIWTQVLPFPAIHTPYFSRLWEALEPYLEEIPIRSPQIPVYSAITLNAYPEDATGIKKTVLANIDQPLRLWQATQKMYEEGARIFVQAGGGATTHTHAKNICGTDDVLAVSLDLDYRSPLTQINHLCGTLLVQGLNLNLKYLFRHRAPRELLLETQTQSAAKAVSEAPALAKETQPTHEEMVTHSEYGETASSTKLAKDSDFHPGEMTAVSDGPDDTETPVRKPEFTVDAPEAPDQHDPVDETQLPFVGPCLHYDPDHEIVIERTLDLNEDLYLRDHLFVHVPKLKPPSACLPVVPMTFSMEAMAEVAAYLAPGLGLIGFENIKANNWISLVDTETLTLRISAQFENEDAESGTRRIAAEICVQDKTAPAISGIVLFGAQYEQNLDMQFQELTNPRPYPRSVDELYRERHLFHGPSFYCLRGLGELSDQGLNGELTVLPRDPLLASRSEPRFFTDPVVLDGVGQLVGMWAQVQEKYIFPIGIQKLELYGDTPPVGTRLPTYLEITEVTSKTMQANIEVQDGAGNVWMRIQGWKDWIFYWWPRLFAFTRKPTVNVLSQTMSLSNLANGCVCHTVDNENLRDFEINALARYFLHHDEMPSFHKLAEHPKRQREWLLGRIAAKDAVRVWLKEENTEEMLHPAEFIIENDDRGQPVVRNPGSDNSVPKISIAHSHGRALAVASAKSIGVDLEYISEKDTTFVEAITSSRERDWLTNVPSQEKAAWVTRLWCAKEAVSKMNGTGLNGKPKAFEAITFERSGDMTIQATENGQTTKVHTYQEENFIIALTSNPNS